MWQRAKLLESFYLKNGSLTGKGHLIWVEAEPPKETATRQVYSSKDREVHKVFQTNILKPSGLCSGYPNLAIEPCRVELLAEFEDTIPYITFEDFVKTCSA